MEQLTEKLRQRDYDKMIKDILGAVDCENFEVPPYDWDDVSDIPEELLTIDNLLGIIETYKQKYNDVLEVCENAYEKITDAIATFEDYEYFRS